MRVPEILIGSLLTIAILAIGLSLSGSPIAAESVEVSAEVLLAQYTFWLTVFTAVLGFATIGLLLTAVLDGRRRSRDTEITQRAYLSVEPEGINPFRSSPPSVVGHVAVRNVGHLPARNVATLVQLELTTDRHFRPGPVNRGDAEGSRVIQSTAAIRQMG
ncbi:MAG: hypothetical protein ACYC0C_15415 [Devosia sp.]